MLPAYCMDFRDIFNRRLFSSFSRDFLASFEVLLHCDAGGAYLVGIVQDRGYQEPFQSAILGLSDAVVYFWMLIWPPRAYRLEHSQYAREISELALRSQY